MPATNDNFYKNDGKYFHLKTKKKYLLKMNSPSHTF